MSLNSCNCYSKGELFIKAHFVTGLLISSSLFVPTITLASSVNQLSEICQAGTDCQYTVSGHSERILDFTNFVKGNKYQCIYSNAVCKHGGSLSNFKLEKIKPSDPNMNITYIGDGSVQNDYGLNIDATQATQANLNFTANLSNQNIWAQDCSVRITCKQQ